MCMSLCQRVSLCHMHTQGLRRSEKGFQLLELDFQAAVRRGCWKVIPASPEEK